MRHTDTPKRRGPYGVGQILLLLLGLFFLGGCSTDWATPFPSPYPDAQVEFHQEVLADGFKIPFDVAILDNDTFLVTDRAGQLYRYDAGEVTEIQGIPSVTGFHDPGLLAIWHGGLMDVELHPRYPDEPWIYISYLSEDAHLKVDRFQLEGDTATQRESVFTSSTPGHYGNSSRIVWQDDRHFFLGVGATTHSTVSEPVLVAQDTQVDWGKIHRLADDGSIPEDNPRHPKLGRPTSMWSYGHRDTQGLWLEPGTGELVAVEHGPKGGDEFNVIQPGGNYGWPLFSNGIDYSGESVSLLTEAEAAKTTVLPEHTWTIETEDGGQAIAPAFLLGVRESAIPALDGRFLFNSLTYRWLLVYDRNSRETRTLPVSGRLRGAAQLPDGRILVLRERTGPFATDGQIIALSAP